MPIWTATLPIIGLEQRNPVSVFDAETPSDGESSVAVAIPTDGSNKGVDLTFTILFAVTPTTVNYQLQVALNNVNAEYFDLGTPVTDTAGGKVTLIGVVARFARVRAVDADIRVVTSQIMIG